MSCYLSGNGTLSSYQDHYVRQRNVFIECDLIFYSRKVLKWLLLNLRREVKRWEDRFQSVSGFWGSSRRVFFLSSRNVSKLKEHNPKRDINWYLEGIFLVFGEVNPEHQCGAPRWNLHEAAAETANCSIKPPLTGSSLSRGDKPATGDVLISNCVL